MAVLARAYHFWQDLLEELPAASWWEPLGPIAHEYAESSKAALVLHNLDEQIHHGAELGVLRDLYLHDRAKSTRSAEWVPAVSARGAGRGPAMGRSAKHPTMICASRQAIVVTGPDLARDRRTRR